MTLRTGPQTRSETRKSAAWDGPSSLTRRDGITLIELILVMAILAMVAAISVPRLTGFSEGREFVGEWNRFTTLVRFARSQAISRAAPVEVQFADNPVRYLIAEQVYRPDNKPEPPVEHVLPKKLSFEFPDLDEACHREDGRVSIRFLPDGSVDDQSPKLLRLVEQDGPFMRTLEQDPVFGYVGPKTPSDEKIVPKEI